MQLRNSLHRYGIIAIFLHWLMAVLIIALLALGLYMVRIPISLWKLKLYGWHKELGVAVIFLVVVRILWRFININPVFPADMPAWQQWSARSVHWLFYLFMFMIPISGWLISSAAGLPVSFFGLFVLPDLVAPSEIDRLFFTEIHRWSAYLLIFVLCIHATAALKHHFIDKNDILRRIL